MKTETIIQIGNVKIWERNGEILVCPCNSVYDSEFKKVFPDELLYAYPCDTGVIPRDPNFLIKDEDGVFHKFNKMEYLGIAIPATPPQETLEQLGHRLRVGLRTASNELGILQTLLDAVLEKTENRA